MKRITISAALILAAMFTIWANRQSAYQALLDLQSTWRREARIASEQTPAELARSIVPVEDQTGLDSRRGDSGHSR